MTPEQSLKEGIASQEMRLLVIGEQIAVLLGEKLKVEQHIHKMTDILIGYEMRGGSIGKEMHEM